MHGNYPNRQNRIRNEAPKMADTPVQESVAEANATDMVEMLARPQVPVVEQPDKVFGIVIDCNMLYIRMKPDAQAEIAAIVPAGAELMISENATNEFYQVCTAAGIEGFCMKKYIKLKA